MSEGILVALTNTISSERDDEFNQWYNQIHGREVTSLPGFSAMTRYRAGQQILPSGEPAFRYLAIYELSDVDIALRALAEASDKFEMSDSLDLSRGLGIAFMKIYSTKD